MKDLKVLLHKKKMAETKWRQLKLRQGEAASIQKLRPRHKGSTQKILWVKKQCGQSLSKKDRFSSHFFNNPSHLHTRRPCKQYHPRTSTCEWWSWWQPVQRQEQDLWALCISYNMWVVITIPVGFVIKPPFWIIISYLELTIFSSIQCCHSLLQTVPSRIPAPAVFKALWEKTS